MRSLRRATLCVVVFAPALVAQTSAAGPLPAQTVVPPRWGLVAGTGLGIGLGEAACSSCPGSTTSGPAGYARLGGAYRENVVLAVQLDWWRGDSRGATPTTTTIWNTSLVLALAPRLLLRHSRSESV